MSDINKTISERNWPFSTLALTKIDDSWLNQHQHQHQHQHHNIYRLRYSNHPSNAIVEHPHQKDMTSLKNELFDISRENNLLSLDIYDLNDICQPETQLIYVPQLELHPNEEILESLANFYQVSTVISLYSIHPFIMTADFVYSFELIKKHIKANTYRSGARIITDCDATCSLLLVLEDEGF